MSWIGNLYDHLHDDLGLPELPGMSRETAEDIVGDAFAPGSPLYHHLRHNSQLAEFLLPGLDLNFEENYNDFYDDLVEDGNGSGSGTLAPEQDSAPPSQEEDCSPPPQETDPGGDPPPTYFYPLPGEVPPCGPILTVEPSPCEPEEEPVQPSCEERGETEQPCPPSPVVAPPLPARQPPSRSLEQGFRFMAGGDRELSSEELFGSMQELEDSCSPYHREIESLSGIVDINDDSKVSAFEASTIHTAMDEDRNGSVSLFELNRFLQSLSGA